MLISLVPLPQGNASGCLDQSMVRATRGESMPQLFSVPKLTNEYINATVLVRKKRNMSSQKVGASPRLQLDGVHATTLSVLRNHTEHILLKVQANKCCSKSMLLLCKHNVNNCSVKLLRTVVLQSRSKQQFFKCEANNCSTK